MCWLVHLQSLQLSYSVPTDLAPDSEGRIPFIYGLEGFDRDSIGIFLKGCCVRADQAPLKPAEQPAPHPIVVDRAFEQCQVGSWRLQQQWLWLQWAAGSSGAASLGVPYGAHPLTCLLPFLI